MKKNNKKMSQEDEEQDIEIEEQPKENTPEIKKEKKKIPIKKVYTLEELITRYKELEELEIKMKNLLMDVKDQIIWIPNLKKSKFNSNSEEFYDIILKYCEKEEKNEQ